LKRIAFLLLIVLLAGCDLVRGLDLPGVSSPNQTEPATSGHSAANGATRDATAGAMAGGETPVGTLGPQTPGPATPRSSSPTPGFEVLTLWVPPEFDPDSGGAAGEILRRRLDAFSQENGGVRVQVRVKAAGGPGGLLESLNATSAVAPMALPSVVALPRPDLEIAALKGLVYPLDGLSNAIDAPDWYGYARQLAMVQGTTFALPFAGDALVIAYRPGAVAVPPIDWESLSRLGQPLAFPAGDPQALFVLALYQGLGGVVEDAQRRPTLQADVLSRVLQTLADGEQRGVFPYWLSQYETGGQVWQAYRDLRVNALVTWASNYLSTLPPDTSAAPLPALGEDALTLATGWGWAVADPIPERRALSARLVEALAEGDFLAEWTEAAGYLPTRPSSLAAWKNGSLKTLLSPVAAAAQARPTGDQLASLGPVLEEAALKVLKRESDPTQAAKAASERLAMPETK
jgi:ABC-type glycerol-3-phosphate transport system substrate-binding protein